jgi:hypothetical protein
MSPDRVVAGEYSSRVAGGAHRVLLAARRTLSRLDREIARHDRLGLLLFGGFTLLYWVLTVVFAARKLMWNDELYTFYVATLPSAHDVWASLLSGGEQTPPLFYLTTRLAMELFGTNHVAIRLPEMVGFWVMSACLLVFVARRTSWLPAACAATLPLVTDAYKYAFEARAYGMVLGFSGLALISWQSAALNRSRRLALACLAASLSAAFCSHYYAIFLLVPLALGEMARTVSTRRIDPPVWTALAVPIVPLALHLPLIRAGQTNAGTFWSPPRWVHIPDFYSELLAPAVLAVALILVLALIDATLRGDDPAPAITAGPPPAAEVVVAGGFALLPVVGVVVAKVSTGAFTSRYALPAVLGLALLSGFGAAMAFRRRPLMQLLSVISLIGWFALSQAREYVEPTGFSMPVGRASIDRAAEWLDAAPYPDLPFVIADPHTFTVLSHYGPPGMKRRLAYLAEPDLALKHLGHNSVERGMLTLLRPWFRMNVVEFEPFVAEHPRFLLYGDFFRLAFLNWITADLRERRARFELLNQADDYLFLLVIRDGVEADASITPGTPVSTH